MERNGNLKLLLTVKQLKKNACLLPSHDHLNLITRRSRPIGLGVGRSRWGRIRIQPFSTASLHPHSNNNSKTKMASNFGAIQPCSFEPDPSSENKDVNGSRCLQLEASEWSGTAYFFTQQIQPFYTSFILSGPDSQRFK